VSFWNIKLVLPPSAVAVCYPLDMDLFTGDDTNLSDALLDPRTVLSTLSRAELERILRERLEEGDEDLSTLILSVKTEKKDRLSPPALVDRFVRRHRAGQYGFIEDSYGFARDLRRLIGRAAEAGSAGDALFAVGLMVRAIEVSAPHAFDGADEEGEICDAVNEGFEQLALITGALGTDSAALRELGAWALQGVDASWAEGDSWDISCLGLVAAAARSQAEVSRALELCARFTDNSRTDWDWIYHAERAALVAAELLKRTGDETARSAYIEKHLFLANIRTLAIDEATAAGNHPRAVELCRSGIGIFQKSEQPGIAVQLSERLIEALDRMGERNEAAKELEKLLLESFSRERYSALKGRYPEPESWTIVREGIIDSLKNQTNRHALAVVYQAENMSEALFALAERDRSIFHEYLDEIGRSYPEPTARFLKVEVEQELQRTASRNSYVRSAETILRYGKYAGAEAAAALFDSLLALYPSRRAMREEFERIRHRQ